MTVLAMEDLDLANKRLLIREDLNVPVRDGVVTNTARIDAALPTLEMALERGAAVIVMSHLGRPTEGEYDEAASLKPVAAVLSEKLGRTVPVLDDWAAGVDVEPGDLVLLENIRFAVGEKKDDPELAQKLAGLADIYVMDAFGTAHRAQASTHGVSQFAAVACAGPLLKAELDALEKALAKPAKPVVALVGGSKVSTKLEVLESLSGIADQIIVVGGIANTFLLAAGHGVGESLAEEDLVETARGIAERVNIPLPVDVMTGTKIEDEEPAVLRRVEEVGSDEMILDIGPETARRLADVIDGAGTIIWNGPVGVFEIDQFGEGTRVLAEAIAESDGFSIAGGGDTLAAIDKYDVRAGVSYISTGGGAFLEYVEGKTLPAVAALEAANRG